MSLGVIFRAWRDYRRIEKLNKEMDKLRSQRLYIPIVGKTHADRCREAWRVSKDSDLVDAVRYTWGFDPAKGANDMSKLDRAQDDIREARRNLEAAQKRLDEAKLEADRGWRRSVVPDDVNWRPVDDPGPPEGADVLVRFGHHGVNDYEAWRRVTWKNSWAKVSEWYHWVHPKDWASK